MTSSTRKPLEADNIVHLPPDWKSSFQSQAMRSSFCLALTQPMLEFLCATAEGVHWDRRLYTRQYGIARPDSWLASSAGLMKRGLIERLTRVEIDATTYQDDCLTSHYRLTPAGSALVELLKVAGIFVESDSAVEKRERAIVKGTKNGKR
jgi:hypothetical protein